MTSSARAAGFAAAVLAVAALVTWFATPAAPERSAPGEVAVGAPDAPAAPLRDRAGSVFRDARGRPYRLPGGGGLPRGTRRDRRGRFVLPDGSVWVPGADGVLERVDAEGGAGARPERPVVGPRREARADRGRDDGPVVANVRPAGDARVEAGAWEPSGELFAGGAGRPRTSVPREPHAARARAAAGRAEGIEFVQAHGLRGDYFDFLEGELRGIPELAGLPPTLSRIDLALDFPTDASFALPFPADTFAVLWRGLLEAPESGRYRFTFGSDDGVRLVVAGQTVVDHGGLRPYGESSGLVELAAGRHPVEVTFYENHGFASCRLFWEGPSWGKRLVPPERLFPPEDLLGVVRPAIARVDPGEALVGDEVRIEGSGFSGLPGFVAVTIAGVPAEIVEASAERLVVRVPVGAESGDLVVRVGEISSLPVPFGVRSVGGLFAEYFRAETELADYPPFDALAPYFVRLDGPLDFQQDPLWRLPHDPDVFGARFTGYLFVPEEDEYRIWLGSDDGARLSLDGRTYIDLPGLHPYREGSRASRFTQGFHPLEIVYFENRGVARLRLLWQRRGEPDRSPVPRGFLFPPEELVDRPAPALADTPLSGARDATIRIEGSGLGDDPRFVRVLFPGDVWVRPTSVEPGALTVRIPWGTESGAVRVDVGVLRSNPVPFTLTSPIGLTADYHVFSDEASLRAAASPEALASRTPHLSRTETSFRRLTDDSWDLPFPARNFAVRFHGTLTLEQEAEVLWILQADDGAILRVDGALAADCGPFHGLVERYGVSRLPRGPHRVDLWYFQAGGEARLDWLYTPHGLLEHLEVPGRWFAPD